MRRRRSERRVTTPGTRTALVVAVCVAVARSAPAQTSDAGGSFLIIPVNPRSVGMGGAGVADPMGTSALLLNPAAFGRLTGTAVEVDYGVDDLNSRLAASATYGSRVVGTFGAGLFRLGQPVSESTDDNGTVTGLLASAELAFSASYGVAFTSRLTSGVSAKLIQRQLSCTGECRLANQPTRPSTGAVDIGAQYDLGSARAVHLGVALRNFGLRFQNKDRAQADPLPTQLVVGGAWDIPGLAQYVPDATLRLLADGTHGVGVRLAQSYHVGAEAMYRKTVMIRAGYAHYTEPTGYAGLAAGFGVSSARFTLDVARQLTTSADLADRPPTYVGLRYTF